MEDLKGTQEVKKKEKRREIEEGSFIVGKVPGGGGWGKIRVSLGCSLAEPNGILCGYDDGQ